MRLESSQLSGQKKYSKLKISKISEPSTIVAKVTKTTANANRNMSFAEIGENKRDSGNNIVMHLRIEFGMFWTSFRNARFDRSENHFSNPFRFKHLWTQSFIFHDYVS